MLATDGVCAEAHGEQHFPWTVGTGMWKQVDRLRAKHGRRLIGSVWDERVSGIVLKRAETPDDIAAMASFLASSYADFNTVQACPVDGGLLMLHSGLH